MTLATKMMAAIAASRFRPAGFTAVLTTERTHTTRRAQRTTVNAPETGRGFRGQNGVGIMYGARSGSRYLPDA